MRFLISLTSRQRQARRLDTLRRDPHLARDIGLDPLPSQRLQSLVQW